MPPDCRDPGDPRMNSIPTIPLQTSIEKSALRPPGELWEDLGNPGELWVSSGEPWRALGGSLGELWEDLEVPGRALGPKIQVQTPKIQVQTPKKHGGCFFKKKGPCGVDDSHDMLLKIRGRVFSENKSPCGVSTWPHHAWKS